MMESRATPRDQGSDGSDRNLLNKRVTTARFGGDVILRLGLPLLGNVEAFDFTRNIIYRRGLWFTICIVAPQCHQY